MQQDLALYKDWVDWRCPFELLFWGAKRETMRRRDFVKGMVSATLVPKMFLGQAAAPPPPPPAPVPWTLGLTPVTPVPKTVIADAVAQSDLYFFTPAQMATLTRLSDVLLPPIGSKPGAVAAEAPVFLDFLIGKSPADRKQFYQGGLDWLDAEAKRQFSVPFAQLETSQADRILQPWMRSWMSDHPPTEAHADFINIAHADIRTATVNSKAWSAALATNAQESTPMGLYWYPIEPERHAEGAMRMHVPSRTGRSTH